MLRYARPQGRDNVELVTYRVSCGGMLAQHFHDEVQISLVLSGHRRFVVGGRNIDVGAGSFCVLPARVPHRAIGSLPDTVCLNIYVPPDHPLSTSLPTEAGCPELIQDHGWLEGYAPVTRLASQTSMTREGITRRFSRAHGMPPQAFRRMLRLNRARQLLRTEMCLADVAAETGFADQSHLGRWFRQAFGTTPARYRAG